MVSKNNHAIQMEEVAERQPHFGIRKLTVGVASVLLGTTLWLSGATSSVHAETIDTSNNGEDKATDESNTKTPNIDNNTKVIVQTNGNDVSTDQKVETNENKTNSNKGLEADAKSSAVQSTIKEAPKSGSTSQTTDRSAQSVLKGSSQNTESANKSTENVNNTNTAQNKAADSSSNQISSKTSLTPNDKAVTTNENKSTIQKGTATDLSKIGLKGVETNKIPETTKLPASDLVQTYTGNAKDNETNVNQISGLRAAQLLAASLVQNTTGTDGAVDIDNYTANFNIKENPDYQTYFAGIPADQIAFQAYEFKSTGQKVVVTTSRANVGNEIRYYSVKNGTATLIYTMTPTTQTNAAGVVVKNRPSTSGTFATDNVVSNSVYQGGTYKYDTNIAGTVNVPGIGTLRIDRLDVTDGNGKSPVTNGTGAIITDNSHRLSASWANGEHIPDSSTVNSAYWNSGGSNVPSKLTQNIWYVDAKTGDVLSHKISDEVFSGSSYDSTSNGLETITHDGKTYKLVARNANGLYDANDFSNILKKQLDTNNGLPITVGDVISTPLKGTLSAGRIGNINIAGTDYQGVRAYISQQITTDGAVTLNTYTFDPGSTTGHLNTGLSRAKVASGQTIEGAGDTGGGGGAFYNGTTAGNRDIIFLYDAQSNQKAHITFVDDDNGGQEIPSAPEQSAEGDAGSQIHFTNAGTTVNTILSGGGYVYNGTTGTGVTNGDVSGSFSNVSFPSYDSDDNTDQGFVVHFKHKITPVTPDNPNGHSTTNLTKTVTRTIHYKYQDTKKQAATDVPQKLTFNGTAYYDEVNKDYVTGPNSTTPVSDQNNPAQSWAIQGGTEDNGIFDAVTSPTTANGIESGYKAVSVDPSTSGDSNYNVISQSGITHDTPSSEVTVYYNKETPTYKKGKEETKTIHRTINYYDKVTREKIPSKYIINNPYSDSVTFTRTEILDQNGNHVGYGTISADGKSYQDQDWNINGKTSTTLKDVNSPSLTNYGYTAPVFDDDKDASTVTGVKVDGNSSDLVYNVYYGHQTQPVNTTKTVKRTFNYVFTDDTKPSDHTDLNPQSDQTVTFNGTATKDLVTGQTSETKWTPTSGSLDQVGAHPVKGYKIVSAINGNMDGGADALTVTPTSSDTTVTIVYTPVEQKKQQASVKIVDKTNNNTVLSNFSNDNGVANNPISFDGEPQALNNYIANGYVFDSAVKDDDKSSIGNTANAINFGNFDNIDENNQSFTIYLVHGTTTKTEEDKNTATVHYIVSDGRVPAPEDNTQTVDWTKTDTVDAVTGKVTKEGTWTVKDGKFDTVTTPSLTGYTADKSQVDAITPVHGQNPYNVVVYTPNEKPAPELQKAQVEIIDKDNNNTVLSTFNNNQGTAGNAISFDGEPTTLQSYLNAGYVFDSAVKDDDQSSIGNSATTINFGNFDDVKNNTQQFKIYLVHGKTQIVNKDTNTATVHYIVSDGKVPAPTDKTDTVTWTKTDTVDKVTGKVTEGSWTSDKPKFEEEDTPTLNGYTPDKDKVGAITAVHGVNPYNIVIYTPNAKTPDTQTAVVIYRDVNGSTPQELERSKDLTGQAGDAIDYDPQSIITKYENEGYVLVSNGFNPNGTKPNFDNDSKATQTFYIDLKHGIQPVNPNTPGKPGDKINPNDPDPNGPKYPDGTDKTSLTKDVTRTVTYEGAGSQTPSPVTDTLHFEGTGYLDKVTGKWTDAQGHELSDQTKGITWTIQNGTQDNGSFDLVPTKHIDGYTSKVVTEGADDGNGNVKSYTGITHVSNNINVVVQYNPIVAEKGNVIVKFYDDTDKKPITGVGTDTGSQNVGTPVTYNPSTDLTNLENKGYVYVSTDGNIPSTIVKGTTTVTIHVKHGLQPVNPSTPGKPGDKINPNDPDPNGPKYPDGTDKTSIDKTVTRTIHYEGADQYTPNDVQQPVHFTAEGVLDKVTGQWVTLLTWSDKQTFGAVTSPQIPGYHVVSVDKDTTDKKNVDSATIDHTATDYKVIVTYAKNVAPTPDSTTGKIAYIDDTTGNTLKTDSVSGNVGTNIDYTTQDKIQNYENMGYKLVSNNFTDGKETFDKDANKNNFEVHLIHTYVPVNPTNPGKPGDKINPNDPRPENEQPKYPNGTSETDLTKTITRTIQYSGAGDYTPADVKEPVNFTASGEIDRVTGKWSKELTWSPDQTFTGVKSPKIPGYHVVNVDRDSKDKQNVDDASISHTGSDYIVHVVYAPDAQKQSEKADLHIIDLSDNNKELVNFNAAGDDNTAITFNGAQTTIDALIKGGYKVTRIAQGTSDPNKPIEYGTDYASAASKWTFDDKPGTDQSFYVYVEHDYAPINPENAYGRTDLTKTVVETVHYVDEATNKPVASDYTNTATFKGQGKVDKVTGKMLKIESIKNGQITYDYNVADEIDIPSAKLSDFAWSNPVTLQKVTSPTIAGYTIDAAKTTPSDLADGNDIKEITGVAYDHGNIEATVYYKANPQESHKAELTIYVNNEVASTASVTGAKNTAINFGGASDIVNAYISNGYTFDHAQDVTNNKEMTGKSYSELNFGNFATENNSDQKFAIYLTKKTTPVKSQQNAQLTIRDVTPGQEMDLGNYTQPGLEGNPISFSGASDFIQSLLNKGYVWDSASYNGSNLTATNYAGINFGNYDNTDDTKGISQKWIINLVHGATPVNPGHPDDKDGFTKDYLDRTITRDVTYVYEDGSQAAAPEHQSTEFKGSGYLDNVTHRWVTVENGKITGVAQGLTWTPDQDQNFSAIAAKTIDGYYVASVNGNGISGYTVGQDGAIGAQTVNRNTASSTIKIVYAKTPVTPVPANGSITYYDDTTGDTLENASFGGNVGGKIGYTTADRITYYEGKGYKLISNNFADGKESFNADATKNVFKVHLAHVVETKDANKTITRDVTYVYEDGSQADTPVHQSVSFTGKTTTDKVTGQTTTKWDNESQNLDPTKSIDTTKYNIIKVSENNTSAKVDMTSGVVAGETVTPTSQNSAVVITLAKKPVTPTPVEKGTVIVNYVDKTTGNTLETASTTGNKGDKVNYSTQNTINKYINEGYKLQHDGYPTTTVTYTNNTQTFEVDLVHDTVPVNPGKPGKPGDKINPNDPNPNGPKYPEGTDAKSLTRTITRTINYVGDGLNIPSSHAEITFTGSGVLDKVTGQWITPLTWTVENGKTDSGNFNEVTGPKADGYQITYVSASNEGVGDINQKDGTVAAKTITHTNSDIVIDIYYAKTPVTPVPANGSITYYDDTTGDTLESASFGGNVGQKITYTTADRIAYYEDKGYDLVSNDFKDGQEVFTNGANKFEVHLIHATTPITPDKPGKPGDEVPNPKDPKHPHKIPANFVPQTLTKTVTRDVTYVYDNGSQASAPVHQEFTFTGQGVVDLVTGHLVNVDNTGKITGAGKITWNAENHDFADIPAINHDGYYISNVSETGTTANVDTTTGKVAGETITPTSPNSKIIITLTKKPVTPPVVNKGTVVINYVDKTTGNTLETATSTGNEGDKVNYSTQNTINKYINEGYKLQHDGYPTTTVTYTKGSQTFEVDLIHDTVPVNPDNPGKPGDKINPNDPNPNGPKYPEGTDAKNLTRTITRTINYVGDGLNIPSSHAEITFTGSGVLDKVTGQWTTPLTWTVKGGKTDSSEFAQVVGPKADGYTITNVSIINEEPGDVDQTTGTVASKTINHTNGDIVITINYAKKPAVPKQAENANLHIIDISDNNKEITHFNDSGDDNTAINFAGAQTTIDALIKAGYKVNGIVQATNDPNAPTKYGTDYASASSQWKFDDKPGVDQVFYVYVEHDYAPINPENAYGRTDLTKTVVETVHYVDESTGKPVASDYTNTAKFSGQGRVDKVTGKMLKVKSVENGQITYDYNVADEIDIPSAKLSDFVWSAPVTLQKAVSPVIKGYTIDAAKTIPSDLADGNDIKEITNVAYDHGNIEATVYYKANQTPVTPVPANGSITYYDDTTGTTLENASFNGNVGQKITYTTADRITYYENKGYDVVSNNFKDGNETFTNGANKFEVHLVHATTPITPDKPGKPGEEVPNPKDPKKNPHKIPANFVPQTLTKTVTRDVTYVYDDGSQASAPVHQTFTFTGQGVVDLVTGHLVTVDNTGKITGAGKITWNADSHNFDATNPIKHDGYNIVGISETGTTANVDRTTGVVAGETITPTSQNSKIVITLSKKPVSPIQQGSITVTVHDVKTNQDVPGYGKDSGKQKTGTDFNFDKTTTITDLQNKGYKVINPDVTIPTKVGDVDQHIIIYVDHQVVPVTPDKPGNGLGKDDLNKTVTETVHYVVNGDATAPADKTTNLTFTGTAYYDSVTKKWTDANGNELKDQTKNITWTAENGNKFNAVETPKLDGYTPTVQEGYDDGNKNVKEIDNITPDAKNVDVTVTYNKTVAPTKKQGSITVVVHDDTDNKDIYGYTTGKVDEGTKVTLDHDTLIKTITNSGYKVVKDVNIPTTVGDSDQTYVIHVTKETTPAPTPVTPVTPVTPAQPTTPTTPTKPKTNPEPNKPSEPKKPSVPETPKKPTTPKKHVTPKKPEHRTPNPSPVSPNPATPAPNRNTTPRPQSNWSNNFAPHGESVGQNNNVAPHGQTVNGWTNNVGPHGEHVDGNGNIVAPNGEIIGYVDQNGNPHYTKLPQTGEDKTNDIASAILGGAAVSIGLIGLAGVKKRRREE